MVIAAFYPLGLHAEGICCNDMDQCVEKLAAMNNFTADARYAVTLPSAEDDVIYNVRLISDAARDTLSEAVYLVDWRIDDENKESEGFSSYMPGHHYRYRDHKLQEYHFEWDSIPFLTAGGGVQRNDRFVDLLPQMLAAQVRKMQADSLFQLRFSADTVVSGKHVAAIDGIQRVKGYDGRYFQLLMDRGTARPIRLYNEYNPGQISEQSVTVEYIYPDADSKAGKDLRDTAKKLDEVALPVTLPQSEEDLMAIYPEVFEKYRSSNYRTENLPGMFMPEFSLPTITGERYTHHKGEPFQYPTVIALLDPGVSTNSQTVSALRKAVDTMPGQTTLLMVFTGSNIDSIEEITGPAREEEAILMSGRSLARDCGISDFPVIIVAGRNGKITDVNLGFNQNLTENVIQAVSLAAD